MGQMQEEALSLVPHRPQMKFFTITSKQRHLSLSPFSFPPSSENRAIPRKGGRSSMPHERTLPRLKQQNYEIEIDGIAAIMLHTKNFIWGHMVDGVGCEGHLGCARTTRPSAWIGKPCLWKIGMAKRTPRFGSRCIKIYMAFEIGVLKYGFKELPS